ncbi:tryptophan permease [Rodentibacter pneumotropicus]|uniref:Aromatic amino acid permease n=1 Tax=Rodentibacter pneumotropicus TaxID=758 RepID=A0A4S2PBS8_9PAST|nr:tryptophan permease [Rodentibacter pneumotropicus]MDC2825671.1 tryptophan permease [Rodentibacter pneumotropicus]NBH75444.1 tryptophan permease [Rodentibacter pneumotropicus]OOF65278.1 tryptophan permease [Rodentibacter pneumotropicus]THA00658.1 tryptophan permease [Rodentibacter pneumotropicus]THA07052.1 tryptophan permease [Rodentibacter pneumotropicus]
MKQQKSPSLLGGAMIIAGTAIGAGMLANPTSTAGVWFIGSILALVYTWFCMTTSGLMILEANLHYPTGSSFDTIVKDLLGKGWNMINGLSVAFVLYILTYAYITSGGGITQNLLNQLLSASESAVEIGRTFGSLIFCIVLAAFVWLSTKAVDRFTTVLIGGMVIAFFLSTVGLLGSVKTEVLFNTLAPQSEQQYLPYLLTALPVCLVSFGFHGNVPSLVKYYHRDGDRVMKAIFIGTGLALIIYILWQLAIQGNLPRAEFAPVIEKGGDVSALLEALRRYIETDYIAVILNFFAYMAIASSFLGVTLGLFDYIADLFKFDDSVMGRTKTTLVTFLPPLLLSLQFPYGFVVAIGYAGLAATIWAAIVPALLAKASRQKFPNASYKVYGGNFMIGFIILFGVLNIVAQVGANLGWFASFTG